MSIRKMRGRFQVRLQFNGQPFVQTVDTKKDAVELEARKKTEINDGVVGRIQEYTLEEGLARYLENEGRALGSYDNLVNKARQVSKHLKGRKLADVGDVADDIIKAGLTQKPRKLKPATINRRLALLKRIVRLAHRKWKWLRYDVAGAVSLLSGETSRRVHGTQAQVQALMLAAKPRTQAAITWAALTGLRKGELRRVQPHHFKVDDSDGKNVLEVYRRTKNGRPRLVPLVDELDPAQFPFGLTEVELTKEFRKAREAAGMEWLQLRDLRRTCGSWIVQRSRSLKAAQDMLGHTTMTITAEHYAHLLIGHVREAANLMPQLRAGPGRPKPPAPIKLRVVKKAPQKKATAA